MRGNGRGGHDQHVGFGLVGLLHQPESLQHAEAVLLVDDNEAEAIEFDFFFDQRVGADDELRLAAIDEAAVGALSVFVERAGEQNDAVACATERSSSLRAARKCCVARISVGAMSAAW